MMKLRHSSADGAKRIVKSSASGIDWIKQPGLLYGNVAELSVVVLFGFNATAYFFN
jgi:hypothetical protein